ncbi:hypothetical protein N7450_001251 [Penicillium hetheringtonii]|uniref:Xylanolytic transcriptional activator regulatory domain-containing protein n=1 Tax=Penicillium hetheringtonii TaxID=911720 RepID=A0AAD6E3S2_9EURO|nr:hypothetical protein N7450_001251 [Penicillium hetheringtonii]
MARRIWWCIYLLDRRLAIETGRPFLIQDVNVDVGLPRNISDERLECLRRAPRSTRLENMTEEPTAVPYLIAMTSYSRVIGKVWEALYGAATSDKTSTTLLNEYLEHLITQSQKSIQHEFAYDPLNPGNDSSETLAWWQVKQQFIMRIRWSSIHLLIRKPMLQRSWRIDQPEAVENEVICMRIAQRIIVDFRNVPEKHPKYTFPFLHYLTNATIIALGLIIKQSAFRDTYGAVTMEAAKALKEHCRKTWTSSKLLRAVWRLNEMAEATLSTYDKSSDDPGVLMNKSHFPSSWNHSHCINLTEGSSNSNARLCKNVNKQTHQATRTSTTINSTHSDAQQSIGLPKHSGCGVIPRGPIEAEVDDELRTFRGDTRYIPASQIGSLELETNTHFSGEMIDDGMEWLRSLFENDVDTNLPPVWD